MQYRFRVGETLALLARRYLFDALIVLGAIGGTIEVVTTRGDVDSVDGPLWLLVAMVLLMTLPLLARRRLPFGAPAFVLVAAGVVSFLEGQAVPYSLVAFFAVLTSSFLLAFLNDRREALLGLLILLSVGAVVTRNDPEGAVGDYLFTGLPSVRPGSPGTRSTGGSRRRPRSRRPLASAKWRRAMRSRRSGPASRASCTTWSRTRSA